MYTSKKQEGSSCILIGTIKSLLGTGIIAIIE